MVIKNKLILSLVFTGLLTANSAQSFWGSAQLSRAYNSVGSALNRLQASQQRFASNYGQFKSQSKQLATQKASQAKSSAIMAYNKANYELISNKELAIYGLSCAATLALYQVIDQKKQERALTPEQKNLQSLHEFNKRNAGFDNLLE